MYTHTVFFTPIVLFDGLFFLKSCKFLNFFVYQLMDLASETPNQFPKIFYKNVYIELGNHRVQSHIFIFTSISAFTYLFWNRRNSYVFRVYQPIDLVPKALKKILKKYLRISILSWEPSRILKPFFSHPFQHLEALFQELRKLLIFCVYQPEELGIETLLFFLKH